jgi:sugar phosphate isomerase/epimerase
MPRLTLGINNCFALKRWPQPREWADIICGELGLTTCQLSLDLLPPAFTSEPSRTYAEASREAAADMGLSIHSVFTGLGAYASNLLLSSDESERNAAEAWYREVIELTALVGARGAGGHIGALSVSANHDVEQRGLLLEDQKHRLDRLARYAATHELAFLLFENLAVSREYGHSIEEARALEEALSETPVPWTLCLDLGHPAALQTGTSSDDPLAWLETTWRHTPVLQLQQAHRGADLHGPFTEATNKVGLVHRDEVLERLSTWKVPEVYLFLEISPAHEADDATVLRELIESVDYWKTGIEACGVSKPGV